MRDNMNGRLGTETVFRARVTSRTTFAALTAILLCTTATGALAQSSNNAAAEMAIEAAVPKPDTSNPPPLTSSDLSIAAPSSIIKEPAAKTDTAKVAAATVDTATTATVSATEAAKMDAAKAVDSNAQPAANTATDTASAPAPAVSVAAADQPVADRLHDMIGAKASHYFGHKNELSAVQKFYTARNFAPIWTQGGTATPQAKAAMARLQNAASDGLDPADYPTPNFDAATTPDSLADADLKLTASILDYARQSDSGRMNYSHVSGDILYPDHTPDPSDILANVTTAKDIAAALDSYSPPLKGYQDLKAKLAELRGNTDVAAKIESGPVLKFTPAAKGKKPTAEVAMDDPRVPARRARLGMSDVSDTHYDSDVADAVRKFQSNADLKVTGQLDNATVTALNTPKTDKLIDLVRVNMERWRWLPRELGAAAIGDGYSILNIPDYTLRVMQNGKQLWTTRVVVGQPGEHATPLLTETMKYITVNPTWNVPPSIIHNEYLPALAQDPTVLQRMGLKLTKNPDGSIHISQPPGDGNALGRIRFNFPNKFLVYQHDTPDKYLFAKDVRDYSHGCMRVQYPDQYAEVLLGMTLPNEGYTAAKIRSMYGNDERDIKFPTPIPVHITYQTAFVDGNGNLQTRKDIYNIDSRMIPLIKGAEGRDLETFVAHSEPNYAKMHADVPTGVSYASDTSGNGGPSFFARLFGGGDPAPQAPAQKKQRRVVTR
jgi:murein L,D-transpeptidase YcbB/YkuD